MKQETRKYFPGFDWVKLIGSSLVVMSHAFLDSAIVGVLGVSLLVFFNAAILNMFIISGFLMYKGLPKKQNPQKYLWSYSAKYLMLLYVISTPLYLYHFARDIVRSGSWNFGTLALDLLKAPLRGFNLFTQLWFLLPLAVGVIICGYAYLKGKQETLWKVILCLMPFTIGFIAYNKCIPGGYKLFEANYYLVINVVTLYLGVLFVSIGMRAAEHQEAFLQWKWWKLLPLFLVVAVAEAYIEFIMPRGTRANNIINMTSVYVSTVIFWGAMQIKSDVLRPYHGFVTLYSGINYFLHRAEFLALNRIGIRNEVAHFFICIILNAVAAYVIDQWMKRKKV